MRYRIKDKTERRLINALFGISEFASEFQDNSLTIRVSFAGNDFGVWFFKTEPVQELAEGWHSYPADEPDKIRKYLVAYDCDGDRDVDVMVWNGECFCPTDDDVVAWREFPEYW